MLRSEHRNGTVENSIGNTLWKLLQNGSTQRFHVIESMDHALYVVGSVVDGAMQGQKHALGTAALAGNDGIVGL